ncbi:nucleoside hydrolase [Salipiger sp. 1_MG-2023]|uniref:nucleoside hydrolase n=1 Tax=Salipiger sp. 1_MG-2023 TaxID=3062665 RepID=UPI0026E1F7C0|nr:nucleoside hydrolase [Salipiger sp. 1_MG-2023]MDO6586081.1 nucleoside hydrolase [Salipiger sp. 1_MG-2023]
MGIWVDTDMGVDDLAALLLAQRLGIDGISLVFGCAEIPAVRANALAACAAFGWPDPVQGAGCAILGETETAERILGASGQPTRGARLPEVPDRPLAPALPALAGWLDGRSDAQILALGPLTNLATLVLAHPELCANIGCITWMGGATGRGNHTEHAEFNAIADPEALAVLLSRGIPIDMVDLEPCRRVVIEEQHIAPLPQPMRDLMGGYLDIGLSRGRSGMALYDPVAAALLVAPRLFSLSDVSLSVELHDAERLGQTIVAPHGAHRVIAGLDADAVRDLCLSALWETS